MKPTVEQFAQWTWERDKAVTLVTEDMRAELWPGYLEEAEAYAEMSMSDWPCGILIKANIHEQHHPGCNTKDWRD